MLKQHPPESLRAFPPLSHCCAMRAGGHSQRGGAALARLLSLRPRQFRMAWAYAALRTTERQDVFAMNKPSLFPATFSRRVVLSGAAAVAAIGLLGTVVGVMITFAAIAASGDVNVNSIAN